MTSYSPDEVQGLIENYEAAREVKDTSRKGLTFTIWLADLDRAIHAMPPKEYQAVLLHGLLRMTARDVGDLFEVHHTTVLARYDAGVRWLTAYLNKGDD